MSRVCIRDRGSCHLLRGGGGGVEFGGLVFRV